MDHQVFICHSSLDQATAASVCGALERSGIRCWMAPRDVLGGQDYAEALVAALESSRVLVLVFSRRANESAHVRRELEQVVSRKIPIVPLRIEDVPMSKAIEYFVGSHHWLDVPTGSIEQHLDRIVESIQALLQAASVESQPPAPAPGPASGPSFGLMARDPECLVGEQVDHYVLRSALGVGGSGAAYVAWDTQFGRKACVKILHPVAASDRFGAAVRRATRALAALQHPGVVRIWGIGKVALADGASLYIAMDLIEGEPLTKWSRNLSEDALGRRFDVAQALAVALAAAHSARYVDELGFEQVGILHGDLKPANVLVRPDDTPVLLDFAMMDVRRLQDPRLLPNTGAPTTAVFGTPGFMAPEQESDGLVTVRSDIYGLGATLCHLFYVQEGVFAILSGQPNIPLPGLGLLLRHMMARSPSQRPSSMVEVIAQLEAVRRDALLSDP